ncbi:hypothetical protein EVAR_587_1 [Eumeta japonica]|uniref:Uncharacterized protein n=1 Tax=Eumeta variegata TaxID=151549 RepID=A0A4C1SB72_EUMVA|nr:hypothetical protein EVAR_587_1 [Eumeta japonica]
MDADDRVETCLVLKIADRVIAPRPARRCPAKNISLRGCVARGRESYGASRARSARRRQCGGAIRLQYYVSRSRILTWRRQGQRQEAAANRRFMRSASWRVPSWRVTASARPEPHRQRCRALDTSLPMYSASPPSPPTRTVYRFSDSIADDAVRQKYLTTNIIVLK